MVAMADADADADADANVVVFAGVDNVDDVDEVVTVDERVFRRARLDCVAKEQKSKRRRIQSVWKEGASRLSSAFTAF